MMMTCRRSPGDELPSKYSRLIAPDQRRAGEGASGKRLPIGCNIRLGGASPESRFFSGTPHCMSLAGIFCCSSGADCGAGHPNPGWSSAGQPINRNGSLKLACSRPHGTGAILRQRPTEGRSREMPQLRIDQAEKEPGRWQSNRAAHSAVSDSHPVLRVRTRFSASHGLDGRASVRPKIPRNSACGLKICSSTRSCSRPERSPDTA